jgi:hypothetical protein
MPTQNRRYVQDADGQWWFQLKGGRRTRAQAWKCQRCEQLFVAYLSRTFCSRECANLSRRKPTKPLPTCRVCGKEFRPTGGSQKHCSHSCAATAMHARRPRTTSASDVVLNADNPLFSIDSLGQWWYQPSGGPRTRAHINTCARCQQRYLRSIFHKTKYCSRRCGIIAAASEGRKAKSGERSHLWTGGRRKTGPGYIAIYRPGHPSIKVGGRRYVLEHRLVMEAHLGRYLEPHEHVHHINGIRDDNRIENLELWTKPHPPGVRVKDRE